MTCAACQSFSQRTLAGETGVQDASVNLMLHNATVTFDTSVISPAGLVEKIRGTGYGAEIPALDQSILDEQEKHDIDQLLEYKQLRLKAGVSLVAGVHAIDEYDKRGRHGAHEGPVDELVHARTRSGFAASAPVDVFDQQ
jgi:Cu+-exporting ATPase